MPLRLLLAVVNGESLKLMYATLEAALRLTPLDIQVAEARSSADILERIEGRLDDIIFLDWQMVGAHTPAFVEEILSRTPQLRVVVLLPEPQRQYRRLVWAAGACNGIPKEYVDQEWLSTVLCVMYRAMQREAWWQEKLQQKSD